MKIAFLIGVNDVGGAEFVSYHHVLMAYRNGFDVIVLSGTTGKFYELIKASGVRIELIGMNPALDIVAGLLKGCDVVFNCNSFAITPMVIQLKQKIGFRYFTILHSDINWVYDQVVKYDNDTDGYYAIHQKIMDSFISYGVMDKRKFVVIPNCVDFDLISRETHYRATVRSEFGFKDGDFVIGMITRVAADKNILDAVKILSKLPESISARLLIVGGASATPASEGYLIRVNRLIQTLQAGRFRNKIIVTGNLATEDVYRTMRAFDIGLNCSPSEGLPIALLEMMGAGIPCVMPGIGDIAAVLTGRGLVIPIRQRMVIKDILSEPCYSAAEIELFVNAINNLHQHPAERDLMGKDAAQYVSECRSLKYQEKHFLNFINMTKKVKGAIKVITQDYPNGLPVQCEKEVVKSVAFDMVSNQERKGLREGEMEIINSFPNHSLTSSDQSKGEQTTEPRLFASVLMPIRDGNEQWIEAAIESITKQDYEGEIQLIVVNHDCRMSLSEKITQITEKITRIAIKCVAVSDASLEFSEVLDLGIEQCTGDIIIRMDCDDIAEPELMSKLVAFLQANEDVEVCGVQLQFFGAKEMVTNHPATITRQTAFEMPGTWFINHPGVAIRKSALLKVGGYGRTKTGFAEDYALWCKILKAGGVIANLPDVLMHYRCYQKEWRYPKGYEEFLRKEKADLKMV